jgi:hypothetical protein
MMQERECFVDFLGYSGPADLVLAFVLGYFLIDSSTLDQHQIVPCHLSQQYLGRDDLASVVQYHSRLSHSS